MNRFVTNAENERLNAGMVRREYFAAAGDDVDSLEREAGWLMQPGSLGELGDLPIVVITHGQSFPGPFAVLESGWREGQEKLAALSTDSRLIVAEKSNHMIQNDEPAIVVEAIRSVCGCSRLRSGFTGHVAGAP